MAKSYQSTEQKPELSPVSENWENTEIAFLATVTIGEVCPDYSPSMMELASH